MQAWKIIYKDLSVLLRDRIALLLLLGMPLSLTVIIGFSTNQLLSDLYREKIVLLVLDQDEGEAAQQFVQSLAENERFQLNKIGNRRVAENLVRNNNRAAILVIGPRFSEQIDSLGLNDFLNLPKGRLGSGLADYDIEIISHEQSRMQGRVFPFGILKWLYHKRRIKTVRGIVVGVLEPYRRLGVYQLLSQRTCEVGRSLGYEACELSWTLEDHPVANDIYEMAGLARYKTYRIYRRAI